MTILRKGGRRILSLLALLFAAGEFSTEAQAVPPGGAGPADARELEAFFDGLLSGLMADRHVPGAVVLVVKDGAAALARNGSLSPGRLRS